jgi:outer membrane protein, multidrug efflux system
MQIENWWDFFHDPVLNDLEALALQNSPTLNGAIWKYQEALAIAKGSVSPLFPSIDFVPNTINQSQLTSDFYSSSGSRFQERFKMTQYTLPFLTTYEFDLFSKNKYGSEAAFADAEAQNEAFLGAQLTLTAAVAKTYFNLRMHDAEEEVLLQTIKIRQDAFEINQSRFDAGLLNYSDVSKAETELFIAKADLSEIRLMRAKAENLLAVLVGEYPATFWQPSQPLTGPPPQIAPILPSEVLQRRPDIKKAERELAAAHANLGVAVSTLFPSLAISTQIGLSSSLVGELFDWKARFFSLAWNGLQTVFDAGAKQEDIKAAEAQVNQVLNHYTETVLIAFQEVEDALAAIRWQNQALIDYEHAISSTELSLSISQERFDKGFVIYLEVVDAERILLETQLAALRVQGQRFLATVDLIKAMGGGLASKLLIK